MYLRLLRNMIYHKYFFQSSVSPSLNDNAALDLLPSRASKTVVHTTLVIVEVGLMSEAYSNDPLLAKICANSHCSSS